MAQVLAATDLGASRCVSDWFVNKGDGQERIDETMRQYPNELATVTIIAVGRMACEGF